MTEDGIAPFRRLVESWDDLKAANAALQARVRELEGTPPKPPVPPPGPGLPVVPFSEPPLKYNSGSWDRNEGQVVSHLIRPGGTLKVAIGQVKQPKSRVIRRDFGLQDPALEPGRGAYLREPARKWRRYELRVKLSESYSGKGEMCTLGLKMHPHAQGGHDYLAFIAWSTTTRWRVDHPDVKHGEGRHDYAVEPVKPGHTYALVAECFWSQGPDGHIKAWTDGKQVVDYRGANYSRDEDKPPYLLVGAYFPSAIEEFSEVFEFSELRIGDIT